MTQAERAVTRGRPRGFAKDRVLEEALELFWKNGYRSTTIRDLEAKLGLSQSSLYNAFGTKQDLLSAALDLYESRIDAELVHPLETSTEGLASVDAFLRALGHWVTHGGRRGCMIINMMAEDGGDTDEITRRTRGYRRRVRHALRSALERAATLGEVRDEAIDTRADLLLGMVLGLNIAARGGASRAELQGLIGSARYQIDGWRVRVSRAP